MRRGDATTVEAARAVTKYAVDHTDTWAGVWAEGDTVFAAFTEELDRHRAALEAVCPDGSVRVVSARRTLRELDALADEILHTYMGRPTGISSVSPDVVANNVKVGVLPAALELAAEIRERWAGAVSVVPKPFARAL